MTTLEGIVLKERLFGEQDKFIDILTNNMGLVELSVKGARKINGKSSASTQLFAYSRFCYDENRNRFRLNSAEPIHIFYGLRNSLTAISLASYFADMLRFCMVEKEGSENVLRLMLNTLHYLENGSRSEAMLKSVFELRLMSEIGFMPDILCCRECGAFEPDEIYFSVDEGGFRCTDCVPEKSDHDHKLKLPELSAIRHIVLTDFDRLFNFRLKDENLSRLSYFTESYAAFHLERTFKTLEFYRSINGKKYE